MKSGAIISLIVIILLIIGGGIYYFQKQSSSSSDDNQQTLPTTQPNTENNQPATSETSNSQSDFQIDIKDFKFSPIELKIKAGDTVTWTNQDSAPHTVTSDSGSELNSGTLSKTQTYSHTFTEAGNYSYYCTVHPMMKAKIIVE